MLKKILFILLFISFFSAVNSQTQKSEPASSKSTSGSNVSAVDIPVLPSQSLFSDMLEIDNVNFSKFIDPAGEGEILEAQFEIKNNIDDVQDLYIFVIATFEKTEKTSSSFEMPVPEKERIRSFVPYPNNIKNFEYKDPINEHSMKLIKYPKDPREGVDPKTGKPYHLVKNMNIWTRHLSKYRNKYFFFNEVVILIFDSNGKPIFKQLYSIDGRRS